MNETNEQSVEQRVAELERYINANSGTAVLPAAATPGGVVVEISTYTIPISLPGVFVFGGGLFVLVCLGVLIVMGSRRGHS